jgi:hypothetical protein
MQALKLASIEIGSFGNLGLGLAVIGFTYFLMIALDVEASWRSLLPWFSFSLCTLGFALMTFLFVLEPDWLGANALSGWWIVGWISLWAFGASILGKWSLLTLLGYYPLWASQSSTDTRSHFERMVSDPYSPAIVTISLIAALHLMMGFRVSWQINERLTSPWKQVYIFFLLVTTGILGMFLGEAAHLAIQTIKVIATEQPYWSGLAELIYNGDTWLRAAQ